MKSLIALCSLYAIVGAQIPVFSNPIVVYTDSALHGRVTADRTYHSVGNSFVIDNGFSPFLQREGTVLSLLSTPLYGNDFYKGRVSDNTFLDSHVESIPDTSFWRPLTVIDTIVQNAGFKKIRNIRSYVNFHRNFDGFRVAYEGEVGYLGNVYMVNDSLWIGFVHVERSTQTIRSAVVVPRSYAIGIASSKNRGRQWMYHGDIIRPKYDAMDNGSNINGIPYLIVEDSGVLYFYVYFLEHELIAYHNDKTGTDGLLNTPICAVAREKVSAVLAMIEKDTIALPWKKYNDTKPGTWDEDGFTGLGSEILAEPAYSSPRYNYGLGMHTDAAYVKSITTYVMFPPFTKVEKTTQKRIQTGLMYLQSKDGLHWSMAGIIDSSVYVDASDYRSFQYVSVFPRDDNGSGDGYTVSNKFSIVYSKTEEIDILRPEVRRVDVTYK